MSDPEKNTLKIAVVGGGITGLAAVHRLTELATESERPIRASLFEKSQRFGGVGATVRRQEYLIETGPDSFITNKPALIRLCERIGFQDELISTETNHRGSLVLRNGKPEPVPDGFMLLSPAKILPVLRSRVFSWPGKLRMGCEYFIGRRSADEDESLASFVRRRFGHEALQRLVQPLVGGIYTSDPEKLSLAATMPRFLEMEKQHRSLIKASRKQAADQRRSEEFSGAGARYGLFATFREGLASFFDHLIARLHGSTTLHSSTAVRSVASLPNGGFQVDFVGPSGNPHSDRFDGLVLAVPAYSASELLRGIESGDAQLAKAVENLSAIPYASTAIVASGYRLESVDHPLDSFGLVVPSIENRSILAASFTSRKFKGRAPAGAVLIRTFIGGAMQPELLDNSDEVLRSIAHDELSRILGIRQPPEFSEVFRHNRAMPQYHVGHLDRVDRIRTGIATVRGLELAGNAFSGVGLPDCVQSGESAAERVFREIVE